MLDHVSKSPHVLARRQQPPVPWRQPALTRLLQQTTARRAQMAVSAERWGVGEVCDWVEAAGLGQYRQRFLHQCVSGRLLVQLTDAQLKARRSLRCHLWKGVYRSACSQRRCMMA